MIGENTDSALLELKLIGDISGSFRVARYQRGYRWGKLEVERLLDDIWQSNGKAYSLQPVVVKRDAATSWELVDGQQRLTTLFLIFMFMQRERLQNSSPPYSIVEGVLDGVSSFNQAQVADERLKIEMVSKAPTLERHLFHLEDHAILRGCLAAFELDTVAFERRARAFHEIFADTSLLPILTGALLAAGDYSLRINQRFLQLGSGSNPSQWREDILTGSSRAHLAGVRESLGRVLDAVAYRDGDVRSALEAFTNQWLDSADAANGLDWRWYFVRYPEMRAGRSGIYACASGALGYSVCMLDKKAMSSYYRDPYLSAIRQHSRVANTAVEGAVWQHWPNGPWFTGYETEARWMRLAASGTEIRCVHAGLQLRPPAGASQADAFWRVCEAHGVGPDLYLKVPQVTVGGRQLDTRDRVQLGAALVRDLANAGL